MNTILAQAVNFSEIERKGLGNEFWLKFGFGAGGASGTLGNIISRLIPYIFFFAGVFLLLYLISGGFSYMFSRGDPKGIQSAQAKITNALLGFFIIFLAFWVTQLIALMLGLTTILDIFK
jgi:hypothetical protein